MEIKKITPINDEIGEIDLIFFNQEIKFKMPIHTNEVTDIAPDSRTKDIANYLTQLSPVEVIDNDDTTIFTYQCNTLKPILNNQIINPFKKVLKKNNINFIKKGNNYFAQLIYNRNLTTDQQERQEISDWSYYQVTDILKNTLIYE